MFWQNSLSANRQQELQSALNLMAKTAVSWMLVSNSNSAFMTIHTTLANLLVPNKDKFSLELPKTMFHPELEIGDIIVAQNVKIRVLEIQERIPDEVWGDTLKKYVVEKVYD